MSNPIAQDLLRILIMRAGTILTTGLESFLTSKSNFLVKGIAHPADKRSFLQEFELFNPSVIVIDESSLYGNFSFLFEIQKDYPRLRIVAVDEGDNLVYIYDKRAISVTQGADLINVIQM